MPRRNDGGVTFKRWKDDHFYVFAELLKGFTDRELAAMAVYQYERRNSDEPFGADVYLQLVAEELARRGCAFGLRLPNRKLQRFKQLDRARRKEKFVTQGGGRPRTQDAL